MWYAIYEEDIITTWVGYMPVNGSKYDAAERKQMKISIHSLRVVLSRVMTK